MMAQLKSN